MQMGERFFFSSSSSLYLIPLDFMGMDEGEERGGMFVCALNGQIFIITAAIEFRHTHFFALSICVWPKEPIQLNHRPSK